MEYIEPKPIEKKKSSKGKKILIASISSVLALTTVGVGAYFLIDKVLLDYNNIELYTYAYKYDSNKKVLGTVIRPITKDYSELNIPKHLRIPRKLGGYPVIEIADNTFEGFEAIESIDFPNTLQYIGSEAFANCSNLSSFNTDIKDLTLIGTDAFAGTAWLDNHDSGEVMIGKFLYSYAGDIEEDTILVGSASSTLIDEYPDCDVIDLSKYEHMANAVFKDETKIKAVEYPSKMDSVNDDMFSGCTSIEKVILPDSITYVGNNAFKNNRALRTIVGLNGVQIIGSNAFESARFSGVLTIHESLKRLGAGAYKNNKNLTKVVFDGKCDLDSIPAEAFMGCTSLTEVVLPEEEFNPATSHIGSIGKSAFEGTKISTFTVPANADSIGEKAFTNCSELLSVRLYENAGQGEGEAATPTKKWSRSYNATERTFGEWEQLNTNQGVRTIGNEAFAVSVEEITSNFKELRLYDKSGAYLANSLENEIHIPSTLNSLGERAFLHTNINKAVLLQNDTLINKFQYGGLTSVKKSSFENVTSLEEVTFGNQLKSIEESAFKGCSSIVEITLPESTNDIKTGAFENCTSLKKFTITSPSFVSFRSSIFKGCTALEEVTITNELTDINSSAFENCTSLTSISLTSENFRNLYDGAFKGCASLESANLSGQNISIINKEVFMNCTSLNSVTFSSTIKEIKDSAFENCSSLEAIDLNKDGFDTLGNKVFLGTSLKEISLGKAFSRLNESSFALVPSGAEEFEGLDNLKIILNYNGVVELSSTTEIREYYSTHNKLLFTKVYVPADKVEAYKTSSAWSIYKDVILPIED